MILLPEYDGIPHWWVLLINDMWCEIWYHISKDDRQASKKKSKSADKQVSKQSKVSNVSKVRKQAKSRFDDKRYFAPNKPCKKQQQQWLPSFPPPQSPSDACLMHSHLFCTFMERIWHTLHPRMLVFCRCPSVAHPCRLYGKRHRRISYTICCPVGACSVFTMLASMPDWCGVRNHSAHTGKKVGEGLSGIQPPWQLRYLKFEFTLDYFIGL